jgi:TetR/AcrR family transcriptional regulator of autoinduction and epiphytic fitness
MAPRHYDRSFRDRNREETRRKIVEAAFRLHGRHGGLATSYPMIARAADVSVPTVYNHFPTRDDLFAACTRHVPKEAPALGPEIFDGRAGVEERLEALVRALARSYRFWAPWIRWGSAEAEVVAEFRRILEQWRKEREALIRGALAPGFGGRPPAGLVDIAGVLVDFRSWDLLAAHRGPRRAEALLMESLVVLYRHHARPRKGDSEP